MMRKQERNEAVLRPGIYRSTSFCGGEWANEGSSEAEIKRNEVLLIQWTEKAGDGVGSFAMELGINSFQLVCSAETIRDLR
jgi:hypothetical protein